jgi:hypothetical protein
MVLDGFDSDDCSFSFFSFSPPQVEKQNRYAFLQYFIEAEQEEREREQEEREREKRRAAGGGTADGQGGSKKKKRSAERQSSSGGVSASNGSEESKTASGGVGDGLHSVASAPSSALPSVRPHLLPRTHSEELALLRHLNAAESAEDPFYLSRVAAMFLPQQQVTKSVRHEDGGEVGGVGSPVGTSSSIPEEGTSTGGGAGERHPSGSVTHRLSDGTFVTTSTTTETVYSNDPLYSTLSLMRAKGITSMPEFIRLLAHQNKVRLASNKISEMPCMCCASELPAWFTSYPYVETKYRVNYTARMCARSIFEWHNETVSGRQQRPCDCIE